MRVEQLSMTGEVAIYDGSGEPINGYKRIVSESMNTISVMKDSYNVLHNQDFEIITERIAEAIGETAQYGVMSGGKKIYSQINGSLFSSPTTLGRDTTQQKITLINSHDGSTGFGIGNVSFTISCSNTFSAAYRGLETKIRHTSSMQDKIDLAMREIEFLEKSWNDFQTMVDRMANTSVDFVKADEIIRSALKLTDGATSLPDIRSCVVNEMYEKGQTAWGVFNGITHYTTHVMRARDRDTSKLVGAGRDIDNKVFSSLVKLVK
jgi:hypothetical protein